MFALRTSSLRFMLAPNLRLSGRSLSAKGTGGGDGPDAEQKETTFKEKGFGIPADYILKSKSKREIPSLADLRAKGMQALKPAWEDLKNKLNLPSNVEDFQKWTQSASPALEEMIAKGKKSIPDMEEVKATPLPAFFFGCAGVGPFMFPAWRFLGAGAILPGWEFLQLAYGACVLSFVGGIRWGAVMKDQGHEMKPDWPDLSLGVLPPCMAVLGLLLPPAMGILTLSAGLALAAYIDLVTPGFPNWYKAFRVLLTGAAIFSLLLTLLLKLILPRKQVMY